jgi:hypothetical protein
MSSFLLDTTRSGVEPSIGKPAGGSHPPPGQVGAPVGSVKIFDTLTATAARRIERRDQPSLAAGVALMTTLSADLTDFVGMHRAHGPLATDTGALLANGYRLAITCACGVVFTRWITPEEAAAEDLAVLARRN